MIPGVAHFDFVAVAVLSFVTLQRLAEMAHARRNEARLLARGAVEYGASHYGLIVALHAAWLAGLWYFASGRQPELIWLAVFFILQGLRVWVLLTLGQRWTTRIIVLPGAPLVTGGPFRYLSHPNYAVVAGEIFVLPMAFGMPLYALLFSLLNAAILTVRIRAEETALGLSKKR